MSYLQVGGLFSTKAIPNYMNTCVIDASILSIINTEELCRKVIELMRSEITIDPKYLYDLLSGEIKSNGACFNLLTSLQHVVGAYIVIYYGKGKVPTLRKWKNILNILRSHIVFLRNKKKFARALSSEIDKNIQYMIYVNKVIKYAEDGDTVNFNKYTFTSTDFINDVFQDVFEDYEIFPEWSAVRSNILLHNTDAYLRFPSYDREIDMRQILSNTIMKTRINKLWKYANTYHNDNYICTDMILRQVVDNAPYGTHLVYYNLLECHLENNNHVYYVPPHKLILGNREDEHGRINKAFQVDLHS